MNKEQKELLALIYWDLGCIDIKRIPDKDDMIHLNIARLNLKTLMRRLDIAEHGDTYE
jgi:hypothetical protein